MGKKKLPGLVETSTNLSITHVRNGKMQVVNYVRSSVDSALEDVSQMVASAWDLVGYPVAFADYYAGWNPDPESAILGLMKATYQDLFGLEPEVMAVHAGWNAGRSAARCQALT